VQAESGRNKSKKKPKRKAAGLPPEFGGQAWIFPAPQGQIREKKPWAKMSARRHYSKKDIRNQDSNKGEFVAKR